MTLSIQTHTASRVAQIRAAHPQDMLSENYGRISSGLRINTAADDPAGLGISKSIEAQTRSFAVAERNAVDGISVVQTADGAAAQVHDILIRLRELGVQGSNGTLSAPDSANLDTEFQAHLQEIDSIASGTTLNGVKLLGGADVAGLNLSDAQVSNAELAQSSVSAIDAATESLRSLREGFASSIDSFSAAFLNPPSPETSTASLDRIRDVDVAAETASSVSDRLLAQAGTAVMSQAGIDSQQVLHLLG